VLRQKFVLPKESWFFTFSIFFLLIVLYDATFNVIANNLNVTTMI
jgi:hypothetical protein